MRRNCLEVAGLENGGNHMKRNVMTFRNLLYVSKEIGPLGHSFQDLDLAPYLAEFGGEFFQSLPIRPQQADTWISAL